MFYWNLLRRGTNLWTTHLDLLFQRSEFPVVMTVTISAKNHVRFVFTSSCLYQNLWLIYVICVTLPIVASDTYCVMCFLRLLYPMLQVFLIDCPFGFLWLWYIHSVQITNISTNIIYYLDLRQTISKLRLEGLIYSITKTLQAIWWLIVYYLTPLCKLNDIVTNNVLAHRFHYSVANYYNYKDRHAWLTLETHEN